VNRGVVDPRALGIGIVGFVLVVVVLLATGNGPAVAIGVVAGLVIGWFVALLTSALVARPGGSTSWTWSPSGGRSDGPPNGWHEIRESAEVGMVDVGEVLEVRSVLQSSEAGDLVVNLVSIEWCEAGLRATIEVRQRPGGLQPGPFAEIRVTDDAGTTYRAATQGGGGTTPARYAVVVLPAPPPSAKAMNLDVVRFFEPFGPAGRTSPGPWTFEIKLG
jgi:hypothetical protein